MDFHCSFPFAQFQSTPAHGGRRWIFIARFLSLSFNPRPHTAGDGWLPRLVVCRGGFNPRPHTAGDLNTGARCRPARPVSIHARTRRATRCADTISRGLFVSIHARTRRATPKQAVFRSGVRFQSTPAHGGRPITFRDPPFLSRVSIHARTRRATPGIFHLATYALFQSTPAHGGRQRLCAGDFRDRQFQSTPAHGGRQAPVCSTRPACRVSIHARTRRATASTCDCKMRIWFQSTPAHGGRRCCVQGRSERSGVSIHARTRRATCPQRCSDNLFRWFQSTPAHGGRRPQRCICSPFRLFQSTPAHGGRPFVVFSIKVIFCFNPRPHTAGDIKTMDSHVWQQVFQSTPAHGGRQARPLQSS